MLIILLVEIFTPYLVYLIAPGFLDNSEKFNLAVEFTRITFPYLLLVRKSITIDWLLKRALLYTTHLFFTT